MLILKWYSVVLMMLYLFTLGRSISKEKDGLTIKISVLMIAITLPMAYYLINS